MVSGFGFMVSGFGFRASGFGFRGFGVRGFIVDGGLFVIYSLLCMLYRSGCRSVGVSGVRRRLG